MTERSDSELLEAWRAGDSGGFSGLVQRYQDPLLRHARGLLGRGSPYEDVVQEVFMKLAREQVVPPPGDASGHGRQLSAWLHKVTRNACMDIIRSETSRKRREREAASGESVGGGLHGVEEQDTRILIEREIGRLPVDQREVLVLRLLAERSYREIADVTGKKIGTVGWLISEGLKTLSGNLAPLVQAEVGSTTGGSGMGVA